MGVEAGNKNVVEPLIQSLKDKDPGVRCEAAIGLGEIGDSRAEKPLMRALNDSDKEVREAAEESLRMVRSN